MVCPMVRTLKDGAPYRAPLQRRAAACERCLLAEALRQKSEKELRSAVGFSFGRRDGSWRASDQ